MWWLELILASYEWLLQRTRAAISSMIWWLQFITAFYEYYQLENTHTHTHFTMDVMHSLSWASVSCVGHPPPQYAHKHISTTVWWLRFIIRGAYIDEGTLLFLLKAELDEKYLIHCTDSHFLSDTHAFLQSSSTPRHTPAGWRLRTDTQKHEHKALCRTRALSPGLISTSLCPIQ